MGFKLLSFTLIALCTGRAAADEILRLDTHLDIGAHFGRPGWDILQRHHYSDDLTQLDYPRMVSGGLDGGFFVVFTPQGPLTRSADEQSREWALLRTTHIRELVAAHPNQFALALTADDAPRIKALGKRFVYISLENSSPVESDLSLLQSFYHLGARMAGPVHFKTNLLADSATDKPRWKGLSPLGKKWVVEMNRLGMIIDGSHSSDAAFDQMLALSKAPILLSHSGCKALYDHPRNLDDDRIRALAAKGGVIQINSVYLQPIDRGGPEAAAVEDRLEVIDQLSADQQRALIADYQKLPVLPRPNFDRFMQNLLHALEVAGVDHVGIGADWDGGGGVEGMEDVADLPKVTAALRAAGYDDDAIGKIWGGNALRVMAAVEREAEREARGG